MGHEIAHTWSYLTKGQRLYYQGKDSGPVPFGKFKIQNQEKVNATTLSNKINENLNEPKRSHHGGIPVSTKGVHLTKLKKSK